MNVLETRDDMTHPWKDMWDSRQIQDEMEACPRRVIAHHFLRYLPRQAPILEGGCGLGAWVIFLEEHGYDIAGIDNYLNALRRVKAWKPKLNLQYGDIRDLPFRDGSFGAVISLGVVEHFQEGWSPALKEARRVLQPEGLLFLTVPMNNISRRLFFNPIRSLHRRWIVSRGGTMHFSEFRYSVHEVEEEVRKQGFEPLLLTWDDFTEKPMSMGLWGDLPQFLRVAAGGSLFEMNAAGRGLNWALNSISRWIATSGVLCIARKVP